MNDLAFPTEEEILELFECEIVPSEEESTQFSCIFLGVREKLELTFDWVRRDISARFFREDDLVADLFLDRVQSITLHGEDRAFLVSAENFRGSIGTPPNAFIRGARLLGIKETPKLSQP